MPSERFVEMLYNFIEIVHGPMLGRSIHTIKVSQAEQGVIRIPKEKEKRQRVIVQHFQEARNLTGHHIPA